MWIRPGNTKRSGTLADCKRDRRARGAPVDVQRAPGLGVVDRERQLFGGFRRLAQRHRGAAEILSLWIGHAPLAGLLADYQVPCAAGGNRVKRVGAGGQREVAEFQRAAGRERGGLVGPGAPLAAFVRIDVLAWDATLERRPAVFE